MTVYLRLTREFNDGRLRAIIMSGQAVVLHRIAVMCKDGDWILREDQEALDHVLGVLGRHSALYRFGAPLDLRWLRHGWSSHFEFREGGLRVRTDFFTRPPRVPTKDLERLWREQNELRLGAYLEAAAVWQERWKELQREGELLNLGDSHRRLVAAAETCLPFEVAGGWSE